MIPDHVAVHNERMKLLAGFFNAVGIALIGVGALAPLAASSDAPRSLGERLGDAAPALISGLPEWPTWILMGLAMHGIAHYVLGTLRKAGPP